MGNARLWNKIVQSIFCSLNTIKWVCKRYSLLLLSSNGLLSVAFQFSFGAENLTKLSSRDGIRDDASLQMPSKIILSLIQRYYQICNGMQHIANIFWFLQKKSHCFENIQFNSGVGIEEGRLNIASISLFKMLTWSFVKWNSIVT